MYSTANSTRQQSDLWQIESILIADAPLDVTYYTNWIIARDPAIKDYGSSAAWSELAFPDVQHISGVTTLNFAEASGIFPGSDLDPLPTTTSNQFYSLFVYGAEFSATQEIDPRTGGYYEALATSITSTPDGLHWNITLQPNTYFQDGVPVTADDFVYSLWSAMYPDTGSVGLGGVLSTLGGIGNFKFLNGTTVQVNESVDAGSNVQFNVTAVSPTMFSYDLGQFYPFMNVTWTIVSPLPKHFLESFDPTTWESLPYSQGTVDKFANGTTVTLWDPGNADNGTPLVGPFSNGPYYLKNYDFTANSASLVKWNQYWNKTGLEALGQFTVTNYNVVYIGGSDQAIAAFSQKAVNELDTNYALAVNVNQLKGIGANVLTGPELGNQEFGVNNNNPIWGTGVNTPNGKTDPTHAADYARDVRRAFSYLVPRQLIVDNLLLGAGSPGITYWSAAYGVWSNPTLHADPYDPTTAKAYLAAAGYNTGVSPITSGTGITGISGAGNVTITVGAGQIGNLTQGPVFLFGAALPLTGVFASPTTGTPYPNQLMFLQVSTDNVTFSTVGTAVTDSNGAFSYFYVPLQTGVLYYRWNFTGYTVPTGSFGTTKTAGDYLTLIANGTLPAVLPPQLSSVYAVRIVSLADLLNPVFANAATHNDTVALGASLQAALNNQTSTFNANIATLQANLATVQTNLQNSITSAVSPLQTGITSLTSQYNSLNSSLGTLQYVAYGAILIAIIALLVAVIMSRRKQ
jgi:ABC-type transport system substrate-binding protein